MIRESSFCEGLFRIVCEYVCGILVMVIEVRRFIYCEWRFFVGREILDGIERVS